MLWLESEPELFAKTALAPRLRTVGGAIEVINSKQNDRMRQLTARGGALEGKRTGGNSRRNFTVAVGGGHEVVLTAIVQTQRADAGEIPRLVKADIPDGINAVADKAGHFDDDMRAFVDALGRRPTADRHPLSQGNLVTVRRKDRHMRITESVVVKLCGRIRSRGHCRSATVHDQWCAVQLEERERGVADRRTGRRGASETRHSNRRNETEFTNGFHDFPFFPVATTWVWILVFSAVSGVQQEKLREV